MIKSLTTPRSRIRQCLRQLWLRSRERAAALKRDNYTCQTCGRKQSMTKGKEFKVQVHHLNEIGNWNKVINIIYEEILCDPKHLETICEEDHNKKHNFNKKSDKS